MNIVSSRLYKRTDYGFAESSAIGVWCGFCEELGLELLVKMSSSSSTSLNSSSSFSMSKKDIILESYLVKTGPLNKALPLVRQPRVYAVCVCVCVCVYSTH